MWRGWEGEGGRYLLELRDAQGQTSQTKTNIESGVEKTQKSKSAAKKKCWSNVSTRYLRFCALYFHSRFPWRLPYWRPSLQRCCTELPAQRSSLRTVHICLEATLGGQGLFVASAAVRTCRICLTAPANTRFDFWWSACQGENVETNSKDAILSTLIVTHHAVACGDNREMIISIVLNNQTTETIV